jgi:hypothetical protein
VPVERKAAKDAQGLIEELLDFVCGHLAVRDDRR